MRTIPLLISNNSNAIPLDCQPPIVTAQLILASSLVLGVVISYLPQLLKIIRTASSDGLSPWYLLLGAISSTSNLLNIAVLQVPIFACCAHVTVGQCVYNLLGFLQTTSQVSMFLSVFFLFYKYFPADKKFVSQANANADSLIDESRMSRDWRNSLRVLRIMAVFVLASAFISLVIVGSCGVPSMEATIWSAVLALIALISSSVQFIPQIIRTWKLKMVGALSIPAMLMQTPGSFLFCYTIAMSPGTNFTSWITYFVGGCLQGILLILCIRYHWNPPVEFIHIDDEQEGSKRSSIAYDNEASEHTSLTADRLEARAERRLLGSTDHDRDEEQ